MAVAYHVTHDTSYAYAVPVETAQHIAYLRPRELPYQQVRTSTLRVEPEPARRASREDYFGNVADHFQIVRPHTTLAVTAESIVEVSARAGGRDLGRSPRWEEVARELSRRSGLMAPDVSQFVYTSPYVSDSAELEAFGRESFTPGRSLLDGAIDLTHRIHEAFEFDPAATTVTTPVTRVFEAGRGVCQDFAHVAIASLRALGLAARYVSGYLLTDPPPGQPRLIGADASHAWVAVYCPVHGWVDLDPTNDVVVAERHVTVAWGRDYGDVSPLRGVLLGGDAHTLRVGVSVVPIDAAATCGASPGGS